MALFKPRRTFNDPAASQSGFPSPGEGAQTTGDPTSLSAPQRPIDYAPQRPTKGLFSWAAPTAPESAQRGFPSPESAGQTRPPHTMDNVPPIFGGVYQNWTPYYDRGAAAYVPNFGKVLTNPIGAGVVALNRPQAFYGPAGDYEDGAIWWTAQQVPTTVPLQGLTSPDELAQLLGPIDLQAAIRTS